MLTAPYGHDGKRETLADVVRHYSEQGSKALPALKLSAAETMLEESRAKRNAFLATLVESVRAIEGLLGDVTERIVK